MIAFPSPPKRPVTAPQCDCPQCGGPAFEVWESVPGGNARYADCGNCGEKHETYFESNAERADCAAQDRADDLRRGGGR